MPMKYGSRPASIVVSMTSDCYVSNHVLVLKHPQLSLWGSVVLLLNILALPAHAKTFSIEVDGFNVPAIYVSAQDNVANCPQFAIYLRYNGAETLDLKSIEFNLVNYFSPVSAAEISKFIGTSFEPVTAIGTNLRELDTQRPMPIFNGSNFACGGQINSAYLGLTDELSFAQNEARPFDDGLHGERFVQILSGRAIFRATNEEPILRVKPGERYLVGVVEFAGDTDFVSGTENGGTASRIVDEAGNEYLGGARLSGIDIEESDGGFITLDVLGHAPSRYRAEDTNRSNAIELSELLRIVQLFNAGHYGCEASSEDFYSPAEGPTLPVGNSYSCYFHTVDRNGDWMITLSELLRAIQIFTIGPYSNCQESEDGFCPATTG